VRHIEEWEQNGPGTTSARMRLVVGLAWMERIGEQGERWYPGGTRASCLPARWRVTSRRGRTGGSAPGQEGRQPPALETALGTAARPPLLRCEGAGSPAGAELGSEGLEIRSHHSVGRWEPAGVREGQALGNKWRRRPSLCCLCKASSKYSVLGPSTREVDFNRFGVGFFLTMVLMYM